MSPTLLIEFSAIEVERLRRDTEARYVFSDACLEALQRKRAPRS